VKITLYFCLRELVSIESKIQKPKKVKVRMAALISRSKEESTWQAKSAKEAINLIIARIKLKKDCQIPFVS
jgi:hypothetical protein